jgi:hypothetical protein
MKGKQAKRTRGRERKKKYYDVKPCHHPPQCCSLLAFFLFNFSLGDNRRGAKAKGGRKRKKIHFVCVNMEEEERSEERKNMKMVKNQ